MRPQPAWWRTRPADPAPGACGWTVGVVLAGIAFLLVAWHVDGATQAAAAVALAVVSLWLARRAGLSADELGLARDRLGDGLRWGLVLAVGAMALIAVLAIVPGARAAFEDDRYAGQSGGQVLFEVLVRIPVTTALVEELVFRAALLGLLLRQLAPGRAVAVSAVLFGLWHVASASSFADANSASPAGGATWTVVPATVVATGVAGAFLAWLRIRTGSVAAPVLVHAAVNAAFVLAVWLVAG